MRILVTGGAGLIGNHLVEKLLGEKNQVIAADNLSSGKASNIARFKKNKNFFFKKHDVKKPLRFSGKIDQIYHLASRASPKDFETHPIDILLTNAIGTLNLLRLAQQKKSKFLFASTSEAYGDPLVHPQKETYRGNVSTTGPRSCYDESKRYGEALTIAFVRQHNVDARIVRIFNTYGPGMRKEDGRVVPNFLNQASKNKPITVYGNGKQTRSFCYVKDLVDGLTRAMNKPKTKGEVFNLGNPKELSILKFAQIVKKTTASESKIAFQKLPKDDPSKRKPDISKAKLLLGWEPKTSLTEGLKKTLQAMKK